MKTPILINDKDYNSPWHELTDSEPFKEAIHLVPNLAKEVGSFANKTSLKTKKIATKTTSKIEDKVDEIS